MIRDAAPRLRKHNADGLPCVIFALDLTWHTHLSDIDIDAAMFGQPLVRLYPDEKSADVGHGGGRQMTEDDRVYVSAVCVMDRRELRLSIYHDPFATQPRAPSCPTICAVIATRTLGLRQFSERGRNG